MSDFAAFMPELILSLYAMAALLIAVYTGKDALTDALTWATAGLMVALALLIGLGASGTLVSFGGMLVDDAFARFAKVTILVSAAAVLIISRDFMARRGLGRFEYPLLVALSVVGMMVMVSAGDLMALYMGLELQSLALYVVASLQRDNAKSTEAGLKYFVLGALSSGLLLYGASLVYGFAGTTLFSGILTTVSDGVPVGLLFGLVFMLSGLAFKVSAVPFHMWTPDVYEGSPTPVTAFFAAAPKIAAMTLFLRVVFGPFAGAEHAWLQIVTLLSIASMILGALAAIGQTNIKRLMAYSSIGHMGYALIGFAAGTQAGVQGVLTYLVIYLAMTVGTFVCILTMRRNGKAVEDISELAGLSQRDPATAYLLALLMFSLIGIPPLAGFMGKWYVFLAAVESKLYLLAAIGFISSVIGAFYYLRVVKIMFFDAPAAPFEGKMSTLNTALLAGSSAFVIFFIVAPLPLTDAAAFAAKSLFP